MTTKITLCLSGGGFRATLFHLGVISALRAANGLHLVEQVTSVSGGSIAAAHLVLNWGRYSGSENDFRKVTSELIDFVRDDVRGRILRRWFLLGWHPKFRRTTQLIRRYNMLFKGARLEDLKKPGHPKVFITCTSMVSGGLCWFSSKGLRRDCLDTKPADVSLPGLPVAVAVAASSAFPPMFPPVLLDPNHLQVLRDDLRGGERLTDGGVFDNLGIRAALKLGGDGPIVVSNASAAFNRNCDSTFSWIFGRTIRTTDIMMSRIVALEEEKFEQSTRPIHFADISTIVCADNLPEGRHSIVTKLLLEKWVQAEALQKSVSNARTDFDDFSAAEIRVIYLHGYEVGLLSARNFSGMSVPDWSLPWDPSKLTTVSEDAQAEVIKNLRPPSEGLNRADAALLAAMEKAATRRLRIWDPRDGFCWSVLTISCVLLLLLLTMVLLR